MHAGLLERLGVDVEADLLERSLVHRSWAYENGGAATNERLEFLGDAVLGLVVTDELFHRHPDLPEGQLAKLRSAVVNMRALAQVARTLDLGECVQLGRGEEATGGRGKASILADTTEAVIGAVYLSCGPVVARDLVLRLVSPLMDASAALGAGLDWKTSLQELGAAHGLGSVEYTLTESGPDHAKTFTALATFGEPTGSDVHPEGNRPDHNPSVDLGGRASPARVVGRGIGASKKEAEQDAAADAWHALSGLLEAQKMPQKKVQKKAHKSARDTAGDRA